jgi:hypothetical protein
MFLDTLYIICCDFYKKREKEIFKTSGLLLLTLIFGLNIMLVTFIVSDFKPELLSDLALFKYRYFTVGAFMVVVVSLLYIRFFRITDYDSINDRLNKLDASERNRHYTIGLVYIILSVVSSIGYIVYKGGMINGWWK